jgi:lysophospholipase L1-like esterase
MSARGPAAALARALLATVSVLLVLLVFEAGLRVKARWDDRELDELGRLGTEAVVRDPSVEVRTKNIIRLSPNPRIIYELIPGLHATYKEAVITINADGFRGPAVPRERTGPAVRIAGLGDSVMFGYGVGDDDPYLVRLRETLAARRPEVAWEVLNSGVPGYNTVMEVETLETKLLDWDPDLVVVGFVANDLKLPNFIRNPQPYWALDRSYLWKRIQAIIRGWRYLPDDRLARPPEDAVPAAYAGMVGLDGWRRAMARLDRLQREHGFGVVVLCHLDFPPEIAAGLDELGFSSVEGGPALEARLAELGLSMEDDYLGSPLTVADDDPHPSPEGHRILARVLLAHLEKTGVIDALVARRSAR